MADQEDDILGRMMESNRAWADKVNKEHPGFFHRNIANQLQMVDFNGLSVLQYAVEWLRVRHIVVCGHYGCGGVKTALKQNELGLLNNWLFSTGELTRRHSAVLDALDRKDRIDALCE